MHPDDAHRRMPLSPATYGDEETWKNTAACARVHPLSTITLSIRMRWIGFKPEFAGDVECLLHRYLANFATADGRRERKMQPAVRLQMRWQQRMPQDQLRPGHQRQQRFQKRFRPLPR